MIRKIYVPLNEIERTALTQLARQEKRDPRAQGAWLIRQSLKKLGLLPPQKSTNQQITGEEKC